MGERVTQSRRADLIRADRLKKALETGASPSFLHSSTNGSCSDSSCSVPPIPEPYQQLVSAEARLQFFEQMSQASPDALSIADSEHRVLWANQTFATMFGYSPEEIVGQPLESLVVPSNRLAESKWVTESLAKGERITLETKRRKKDGTLLDVSISYAVFCLKKKIVAFYSGYHDISDRMRVEALSSALYRV